MPRIYTVTFENVAVSAAQDLFELSPADDKPLAILGLELANVGGVNDVGEAQEEDLRLLIRRGHTTSGSGGSSATPRPLGPNTATVGFSAETNNTTVATSGTTHDLVAAGWNTRVPYQVFYPEELWPRATQADTTLVVRLVAAPADSFQVSGTLWVAELD